MFRCCAPSPPGYLWGPCLAPEVGARSSSGLSMALGAEGLLLTQEEGLESSISRCLFLLVLKI